MENNTLILSDKNFVFDRYYFILAHLIWNSMNPLQYLKSVYSDELNNIAFDNWLDEMYDSNDVDSKRILISIAIDSKYRQNVVSNYIELFSKINFTKPAKRPCLLLSNTIQHLKETFYDGSGTNSYSIKLVRILSKTVFLTHYAKNDEKVIEKLGVIMKESFDKKSRIMKRIKTIDVENNRGPHELSPVFVTFKSEIDRLLHIKDSKEYANIINNELGLCRGGNVELIELVYPLNFSETSYQPVTVNSNLITKENVYISYKKTENYCGRTRSNSADKYENGVEERVHKPISKLYTYSWNYIGKINDSQIDTSNILKEAQLRFNDG